MPRVLLLLAAIFLSACAPAPTPGWTPGTPAAYLFVPTSMRIFPLTRLDTDRAGNPIIICHIEFRDAWGDGVKAAGRLKISTNGFINPAQSPRQDLPPLTWDIDLSDADRNSTLYDRATRTYRIQLVDLPAILATASTAAGWQINLNAAFAATGPGPANLQDDYTLQP